MTAQELAAQEKQEVQSEERTRPGRAYVPQVDILENKEGMRLWVDMPGVEEQDVHINVENHVLSIEGQVSVGDYADLDVLYTEYNVGNYARRFTLSQDIDTEKIQARMTNGVLELDLPKAERAKPRTIQVTAH